MKLKYIIEELETDLLISKEMFNDLTNCEIKFEPFTTLQTAKYLERIETIEKVLRKLKRLEV